MALFERTFQGIFCKYSDVGKRSGSICAPCLSRTLHQKREVLQDILDLNLDFVPGRKKLEAIVMIQDLKKLKLLYFHLLTMNVLIPV